MLTKKQKEVLDFIQEFTHEHTYAPSLEEVQQHFGFASVSTAHHHVENLRQKGYLEKNAHQARAIQLVAVEEIESPISPLGMDSFSIPIVGAANCGVATLLAEENLEGYLKVPRINMRSKDGIFVVRAEGDSMNRAKIDGKTIEEGDFVMIDSLYRTPQNGDYVLSVIDGYANLKKFVIRKGQMMLVPESSNKKHKPIYLTPDDDFMINGKIIDVVKC